MSELLLSGESVEFFAPVSSDMIDGLIGQYENMLGRIENIAAVIDQDAMRYFLEGNSGDTRYSAPSVERLFEVKGAVSALNSAYWSKAMHLTDVLDYMPQKRRDEWNDQIREYKCPDFTESTVRTTFESLLVMRSQFLAERVDGIFQGLSGEHVTNAPQGFGKRMIVANVMNSYGSNTSKCGLINDLRCVVAKFMGRDEPKYRSSKGLINALQGNWGKWVSVDGGAMKIRLYMKGTAHIEIHPDMAWRLNSILAHLYPRAIPAEFRVKPKRKPKDIQLIQKPLPFAVIEVLAGLKQAHRMVKQDDYRNPYRHVKITNGLQYDHYGQIDKHIKTQVIDTLQSIGAIWSSEGWWQFDYDPRDVLNEIVASGCIPDHKSHQFYPTPESLAEIAVSLADIGDSDNCLEPSAGIGNLANLMPKDRTTCVEASKLHCDILTAKEHYTIHADFLKWSGVKYDRIVMNPPFDRNQWQAHLEHAAGMLANNGRLVAILPEGAPSKLTLSGFDLEWHGPYNNQFTGTSIAVNILIATRR